MRDLNHEYHMRRAIEIGKDNPNAPFGTVIVAQETGEVLAEGLNEAERNPILHGEVAAILNLAEARPGVDWTRLVLYTTAEPCPMCSGAILWCGFGRLVYAASVDQLSTRIGQIMISSAELAAKAPFARIFITGGVLAEEAMQVFDK